MRETRKSMHGEWSSKWAFIIAATGAAVGLGNIWKFPYIAGKNGGGAFVLVYLLCVVFLGLPILMAEIMLGRRGRQNPANSLSTLATESQRSKQWRWMGFVCILAGFFILSYYSVIAGWALDYVFQAVKGNFAHASPERIQFLFTQLTSSPWQLILWDTIILAATVAVVGAGVKAGIERSVRFMLPTMLVLLLIMVVYSISTGYFGHGVTFLFHPNFAALKPSSILIALGHAFFTLSLATGSIMMYGAYLPQNASIPRAALIIAGADTFIALLAGLAIFPIVFANQLEPTAGPGLIFQTLPIAFGKMPYGYLLAILFFIMLVFAAFTSAISLLEPSVAWLMENFHLSRKKSAIATGIGVWILSLGTVFSFNIWRNVTFAGLTFFDGMDYLTSNIMLPLGGLMIAIFVAWQMKKDAASQELNLQKNFVYRGWHFSLRYVSPIAISVVFLNIVGIIKL